MVTDRYQHVRHHAYRRGPRRGPLRGPGRAAAVVGIDNLPGSEALETYDLPRESCLVFGQEGPGLSVAMHARRATATFSIAQFGSTRSINAGAAAAIAMHAWVRRHAFGQDVETRSGRAQPLSDPGAGRN